MPKKYQSPYVVRIFNFYAIYRILGYARLEAALSAIRSAWERR